MADHSQPPFGPMDWVEAWRITKGDSKVIFAFIDDGIDFSHPDLGQ